MLSQVPCRFSQLEQRKLCLSLAIKALATSDGKKVFVDSRMARISSRRLSQKNLGSSLQSHQDNLPNFYSRHDPVIDPWMTAIYRKLD